MTTQALLCPFSPSSRPEGRRPGEPRRSDLPSIKLLVGQAFRYSVVGTTGTGVYIGLYLLLDLWTQPVVGNAVAWLITTVATNSVQRRFAFGVSDRMHVHVDQVVGLGSSGVALLATTLALAGLSGSDSTGQVVALVVVNVLVGVARFLTVRWYFNHNRQAAAAA